MLHQSTVRAQVPGDTTPVSLSSFLFLDVKVSIYILLQFTCWKWWAFHIWMACHKTLARPGSKVSNEIDLTLLSMHGMVAQVHGSHKGDGDF